MKLNMKESEYSVCKSKQWIQPCHERGRWLCPAWWQWMLKVTGALEAVEERIIGIGSRAVETQEVSQCADGGCGRE